MVGSSTTITIYSGSKPIAEYAPGATLTNPLNEYVYSGSSLLATIAGSTVTYHHPDHLSNRAETNSSGTVTRTYGQFPFGESWYETGTPDKWKFTSYGRDSGESNLDYASFRYYGSGTGRFGSPDLRAGNLPNPQSLNRYAYSLSDPVNLSDPLGLECTINAGGQSLTCSGTSVDVFAGGGNGAGQLGGAAGGGHGTKTPELPAPNDDGGSPGAANNRQKQTFSQCMAANSSTFSLAGVAQGALNGVLNQFGTSVDFKDTFLAQFLGGNTFSIFYGSAGAAASVAATNTPNLLRTAMGTVTTYGRNTSTITSLNIARSGGLPQALSSSSSGLRGVLGAADKVLSIGMSFTTRLEIDAALAGAEAAYCAYVTK